MTNRDTLLKLFTEITNKAVGIMKGKNTDYATEEDALANFRSSEVLNVDARKALLIRMLDKIKRQVNFIERGTLSVDSAEDDIIDLINYSVLLHALNLEKGTTKNQMFVDNVLEIKEGYSIGDSTSIYKRGDKVEIIDNDGVLGVDIGDIVELLEPTIDDDDWWLVVDEDNVEWYFYEKHFKKVSLESTGRSFGI